MHKETSCPLIRRCRQGVFKHLTGREGGRVGFILSYEVEGRSIGHEINKYTSALKIDVYFKYTRLHTIIASVQ